jgi:hypothetical protein
MMFYNDMHYQIPLLPKDNLEFSSFSIQYLAFFALIKLITNVVKKDEKEEEKLFSSIHDTLISIQRSIIETLKKFWNHLLKIRIKYIIYYIIYFLKYRFRDFSMIAVADSSEQHELSLLSSHLSTITPQSANTHAQADLFMGFRGGRGYAAA